MASKSTFCNHFIEHLAVLILQIVNRKIRNRYDASVPVVIGEVVRQKQFC
jgi:hypothetical protein